MLETITWKQYIIGVMVLAFAWYIAVILIYYRKDLIEFIKGPSTGEGNTIDELEDLVIEIRHSILEQAGKDATKQELLEQLGARLANYSGLRNAAFRYALLNRIIQDAENICGVSLSEEELSEGWEDLPR